MQLLLLKVFSANGAKTHVFFQWSAKMDRSIFNRAVLRYLKKKGVSLKNIKTVELSKSLDQFTVSDGHRSAVVKTRELKPYLSSANLLSPKYSVEAGPKKVLINGYGHGHCVGFCQWGSRGMALSGKGTQEILQHYYPGSQLVDLSKKAEIADRK